MNQEQVQHFVHRYLTALNSLILEQSPHHLRTKLSVEADKDLTNRPLYWSFVERLGEPPNPMTLTFVFDPSSSDRGEFIAFGTPRMEKIFAAAKKRGRFVRLYQQFSAPHQSAAISRPFSVPLIPWLGINYKAQQICDRKKDHSYSVGVNLFSGETHENFWNHLLAIPLSANLPPRTHMLAPLLSLQEAAVLAESIVEEDMRQLDDTWGYEAEQRYQVEIEQLKQYYNINDDKESLSPEALTDFTQRKDELGWQYKPRIEVECVNAGIFYLRHDALR